MLIRVNANQRKALDLIAEGKSSEVALPTLGALYRKGLAKPGEVGQPVTLTSDGRLLRGEITERPADGPADPHEADPFGAFDQD